MAVHSVRCPCLGRYSECKLCKGSQFYDYEVGPRGWLPFTCPTCNGTKSIPSTESSETRGCPTCEANGVIDPGYPPRAPTTGGFVRNLWRIFFGG